jgi:hypothetical protein
MRRDRLNALTRRTLLQTFFAGLCLKARLAASPSGILKGIPRTATWLKHYQASATVVICGIPIFTRQNVGAGYASVEIGDSAVGLRFAAGSWPERARGLNRFGVLEETVIERGGVREIAFAGLITRSMEKTLEQARHAFDNQSGRETDIVLTRGEARNGSLRAWTENLRIPGEPPWTRGVSVLHELLAHQPETAVKEADVAAASTFLYSIRTAALHSGASTIRLTHAGKLYTLETKWTHAHMMTGVLRDSDGARSSEFRAFYAADDPSGIPEKIEYSARSYLRLTFESTPQSQETLTSTASLFAGENI